MSAVYIMALDIGGGSGRCLLLDVETGGTIECRRSWTHPAAPGTGGLGYDLDLDDIWAKLGEASREALARCGAGPGAVAGIAATSMRNTTVLLDADGVVLMATPNQDARAVGESFAWAAESGKEVHDLSGHWPSPLFTGTRLLWLKANHPDLLDRAAVVLSLSDWAGLRMSGSSRAEVSQAGETLLFDQRERDWAFDLIESLGFRREMFPRTVDAGSILGRLSAEAASHLGLQAGTPVAAGGADTQCALLGAGAVQPGDVCVVAGTTMPVQLVTEPYLVDGEGLLWSGQHVVPGLHVLESNGLVTGSVLEWLARIIYSDYGDPVRVMYAEAAGSEPGAAGAYSTFGAAVFDGRKLGIPVGNLTMSHMMTPGSAEGRRHLSRALIEGVAFSARANLEQVIEAAGVEPARLMAVGGMTRSELWTAVLSDVLGRPVSVPSTCEVTSLGAAVCAGAGAGVFTSLVDGAASTACVGREHLPGPDSQKYQGLYGGWKEALTLRSAADDHVSMLMTMALMQRGAEPGAGAEPSFRPSILVTAQTDEAGLDEIRAIGDVEYAGWRRTEKVYFGGGELARALDGFDVFVTEMDAVDFAALKEAPGLKAIIVCRGNPVNVDLESATAFGIPVMNTPGRNADAVADLAVGFMVMLARKMPASALFLKQEEVKAGDLARMGEAYGRFVGRELWRKTVGIIGLGAVGNAVARRVRSFGADVLFYDPYCSEETGSLCGAEKAELDELLSLSDFVTVHAPAVEGTKGLMDQAAFARMKKGAFFINTSRASLVDDDALVEALESGSLAGAALDVFNQEPPSSHDRLVSRDDVITTPHIGGNTVEVAAHQGVIVSGQIRQLLEGRTPDHILNPEVMATFSWTGGRPEPSPEDAERLASKPTPSITS